MAVPAGSLDPLRAILLDHPSEAFAVCSANNFSKLQELLDGGLTNVDATEHNGITLLHWAALHRSADVASCLLRHSAKHSAIGSLPLHWRADALGRLPLHYAASVGMHVRNFEYCCK